MKSVNFISLDLEMNQPSGKIIQVGVCVGSIDTIDTPIKRVWYIDPQEEVTDFITNLTGITNDDIRKHSVPHEQVARELSALIDEYECFVNPVTWGGGDSSTLLDEFKEKGVQFQKFGRRWIDTKTIYTFLEMCKGKNIKGGLRSAMGNRKMTFIGEAHRADVDAHNTLRLFFHMIKNQSGLMEGYKTLAGLQL